jgi:integrase
MRHDPRRSHLFTPHDLRRTAATLAGDLGFDDAWIAKCLDHAASKKQEQTVPNVTGKVYNHSKRMKEKRGGAGRRRSRAAADHW